MYAHPRICCLGLTATLEQEVMLRRLKADVAAQLPPKRRQVVRLPHPVEGRRVGGSGVQEGSDDEDQGDAGAGGGASGFSLRSLCCAW